MVVVPSWSLEGVMVVVPSWPLEGVMEVEPSWSLEGKVEVEPSWSSPFCCVTLFCPLVVGGVVVVVVSSPWLTPHANTEPL